MRGSDEGTGALFSYVSLEARVPAKHPLRAIREIANAALRELSEEFAAMYAPLGRPSIAPEQLLRALLLQAFYSIRSERQLMEPWSSTCCSAGSWGWGWTRRCGTTRPSRRTATGCWRERWLGSSLAGVLGQGRVSRLLSSEHFSVDGTMIEAWASMKSLRRKDGGGPPSGGADGGGRNEEADFRGEKRSNATHVSTTDPDAKLYRKGPGQEAKLCFLGHALMENRSGLFVDARLTRVSGHAERLAALEMIGPRAERPVAVTLGADKGYDTADFVMELREINVTPHVAQNTSGRTSAIDGRTTRHGGYAVSQRIRKRIEEGFGWLKTVAGLKKTRYRGIEKVGWAFTFAVVAYNLVRLPRLLAGASP